MLLHLITPRPGSVGLIPSTSVAAAPQPGVRVFGLYEPMHGSTPRRVGLNMANPIATILAVAMMLRYPFNLMTEAQTIETAVERVLEQGYRIFDIMEEGKTKLGTREMGDAVVRAIWEGT